MFVGYDAEGTPRYCSMRAARENSSFKMDATGSDKSYPFFHEGKTDLLIVTEAPIDLMSYLTLHRNTPNALALCGFMTARCKPIWQIIRRSNESNCAWTRMGRDGRRARQFQDKYTAMGYAVIVEEPRSGKDWNEYLQKKKKHLRGGR